jgi:hypothetical protein
MPSSLKILAVLLEGTHGKKNIEEFKRDTPGCAQRHVSMDINKMVRYVLLCIDGSGVECCGWLPHGKVPERRSQVVLAVQRGLPKVPP